MNTQIEYSASDDDRMRLTNTMLFVALKRLGGFIVVRQEDIAESYKTPISIEYDKLNDGRLRIRAVDAPPAPAPDVYPNVHPSPNVPVKTKKPARKPAAKKTKRKASKTRGGRVKR